MSTLTIPQLYSTWVQVGGNTGAVGVCMVAIALAESGGRTDAVSPSDDHGLWQINSVHADSFPNLWPHRYRPLANARMAKAISGNGLNVGPWCTAWIDPSNCGHYMATPPQAGSPAGNQVAHVAAVLGSHPPPLGGTANLGGPTGHPGQHAWGRLQRIIGQDGTEWHTRLQAAHALLRKV